MRYSVIIPVYNRPDEVDELLQSLTEQSFKDFEVVIVEDGSSIPCKEVVDTYQDKLDIHYYNKPNSGPGQTRNYGAERSAGEYLIILDSFRRTGPGSRVFYRYTKGHQLLHDLFLHYRRHPGRKKENG